MPGGQPVRLGPFLGGLNTSSDPTAIADAELATCENFELDIDGSLVSRPPLTELAGHSGWTERIICLTEAIFGGVHYVIGSNADGVYHFTGGVWTLITNTFQAYAAVQYANKVYLVPEPGSANPGGKWDPSVGFTAVAAIPQGMAAVIHKERMFIVPGVNATTDASRLKFSDSGNFDSWPGSNFVDISQGDGTNLIDVVVYQDNLMCFKTQSTFVFAYDIRPADAVVREISNTIGSEKQYNVVSYENQVYVFHRGWVYEVINHDFHRINTKVPFIRDTTVPSASSAENQFISIVEDRLVCRFLKKVYVYGLRTRTWSEWASVRDEPQFFGPVVVIHPPAGNEYYAGSTINAFKTTIRLFPTSISNSKESTLEPTFSVIDTFTRSVSNGWGTANNGLAWTTTGGSASDYSVNGTQGLLSLGTRGVTRQARLPLNKADIDVKIDVKTSVVSTGDSQLIRLRGRIVDDNNLYTLRLNLGTASFGVALFKTVAGSETEIASEVNLGAYVAADVFRHRFQIKGTTVRAKVWKTSVSEPSAWTVSATDSSVQAAGSIDVQAVLLNTNTNTLPVTITYDNLESGEFDHAITCKAKTKNFDMAVSHQFKRLWWWGADIASNNVVVGIATPIVVTFSVTWGDLASKTWGDLAGNTWGQPLTAPTFVQTSSPTGTGVNRRFAKFLKSLRYRQINFEVRLTTDGTSVQGPARLFTMMIITETKQVVPKLVN